MAHRTEYENSEYYEGTADSTAGASNEVFEVNERVEANYMGSGAYYSGRIVERLNDNVYNILFDDGDRESNVPASRIRRTSHTAG